MAFKAFLRTVHFMIAGFLFVAQVEAQPGLFHSVSMTAPHTHYFEVETTLKGYQGEYADFKMPVWTPGSYLIREYPKNVEGFSAFDRQSGAPLPFKKTTKNCWRVHRKNAEEVIIKYRVYAFDGSIRMSYLDEGHAFIMANTLLMYLDDLRWSPVKIHLNVPKRWNRVSTGLEKVDGEQFTYQASDYDELVDSPIEIGNHEIIRFKASGVDHEIAMYGQTNHDPGQIIRDFTRIIEESTAIFGENPNKRYVFIIHHTGKRQGGLEHANSTVLGMPRNTYDSDESYLSLLNLVAHEYFHLWMVKRLKPVELDTIDYEQEMYTDLLWVMEGLTSYYDEKIMLKTGFYDSDKFINNLMYALSTIHNTPGAGVQSVAESSFDSWIKAYRKDENSDNSQISYYTKGQVLGAMLDLAIIGNSKGKYALDDVLRYLYHEFYKKKGVGITAQDFKEAVEKFGKLNLDDFYRDYVYGTKPLDMAPYLDYAGVVLVKRALFDDNAIGAALRQDNGKLIIYSVIKDGAAYHAGLSAKDELFSVGGYKVDLDNITKILNQFEPGQKVEIVYNRDGLEYAKMIQIEKDQRISFTFNRLANPSGVMKKVYGKWINP